MNTRLPMDLRRKGRERIVGQDFRVGLHAATCGGTTGALPKRLAGRTGEETTATILSTAEFSGRSGRL
jgi:hypothetical protein